VSAVDFDLP